MKEDLSKKLENISVPEIEQVGHRQSLRRALLNSEQFQEKPAVFWVKRLAPLGAVLVITLIFTSQTIYVKVQESRAMGIARNDLEVQKLNLDFAKVKMVAKPTRLPSPEPTSVSTTSLVISPAVSPVVTPSPGAAKEDKMMSVEIDDGKTKYNVLVNMTRKRVEKIKHEQKNDKTEREGSHVMGTEEEKKDNENKNKPTPDLNEH